MLKTKLKTNFSRLVLFSLAIVLALANIYVPKASAASNDFYAVGSELVVDELGPDDDKVVTVTLKAAREMDLKNIQGHFTPTFEDDPELEVIDNFGIKGHNMWTFCSWWEDGSFAWNTQECHSEYHGYDDDLHLQPGDPIFSVEYTVKPEVMLMNRSMPVTIEKAVIDDSEQTVVEDVVLNANVSVIPSENYYTFHVYKEGNGSIITPEYALQDEEVEIKVIPEADNELLNFELNGQDLTDQFVDNTIRVKITEVPYIIAYFHPVFKVVEGDGSEYVKDSGANLTFKIDADLSVFEGQGLISIDDNYIDMNKVVVDPENQTVTFPADQIADLELGEHSFEAWFSYLDRGVARAKFYVVEPHEEDDDGGDEDSEEEGMTVPDTGSNSIVSNGEGVQPFDFAPIAAAVVVLAGLAVYRKMNKTKKSE